MLFKFTTILALIAYITAVAATPVEISKDTTIRVSTPHCKPFMTVTFIAQGLTEQDQNLQARSGQCPANCGCCAESLGGQCPANCGCCKKPPAGPACPTNCACCKGERNCPTSCECCKKEKGSR